VLLLSTKNEVLGIHEVYVGNVNASIVRVAEVLRPALRENCPSIIVVHNYPSGDPSPSAEDVLVARQIASGAEMMDGELLDHIVIGGQSHVSLKEKVLGFGKLKPDTPT
jgi:DNA repair protein RadC